MDDKSLAFAEGQLKRVGMLEGFNPELKDKMKQGIPLIEHSFDKKYDGDQVNVTIYLKKSPTSDHYFLNKFDMQLQKEGQASSIKQTFYVPPQVKNTQENEGRKARHENKYTMKEAYNLLAGRPVFKNLLTKEGSEYQAWVKLNPKNTLANGNYELKQYTQNYGFNLEKVLQNYPIKELGNEKYKQSLIESLNRGNRQKVIFSGKAGNEETLYISPSITTGSLNVYDLNKKTIPLEKLVEKGFIAAELVAQLKQKFGQKQETAIKQEKGAIEKPQQNQVQVETPKQELPKVKRTRKQKIK